MKIWCVINTENNNIIAFHEDQDIVNLYLENLDDEASSNLECKKVKISDGKLPKYTDKYLVPYNKTYIQEGYIQFLDIVNDNNTINDLKFTREMLMSLVDRKIIKSDKKKKKICSVVDMLNKLIEDEDYYTPSINQLENYKSNFEYYSSSIL